MLDTWPVVTLTSARTFLSSSATCPKLLVTSSMSLGWAAMESVPSFTDTPPHLPHPSSDLLALVPSSVIDRILNYEKGREILISLLGPRPHPSEGAGRSLRAGEIHQVLKGAVFLPPQQSPSALFPLRGQLAPAVCPGGGRRQGTGRGSRGGGGGATCQSPSTPRPLVAVLRGSPFLLLFVCC